ncbi:MAG: hypothetical protein ABJ242_00900 [Marinomonas sp.]
MNDGNIAPAKDHTVWRRFFYAAAIFNFLIGLAGMLVPESTLDGRIIGVLVLAFGVIYWLVARDPVRFAPVLWAGVIGKLGVVGLLGPQTFMGGGEPILLVVLAGDLLFALGFLAYLFNRDDADAEVI